MDKRITDKGWAAMRELLDREMPEKRRHRFGWWWLGLLLLPILGYGGWQWLKSPEIPAQKNEPMAAQPMASLAPLTEYTRAPQSEQNTEHSATDNTNNTNRNAALKAGKKKAKRNPDLTTFEKLSNLQSAENAAEKTDALWQHQLPESLELSGSSAPIAPEPLPLDLLSTNAQPINLLSQKTFSPASTLIANGPKPIKKTSHNHWAFGATSALSTEQFNSINGFSTGLTVDWKFARKWGLRTGVMYNIHTPQEKYRPVASVPSTDYQSNVYGDVIILDLVTGQEVTNVTGNNNYGDSLAGNVFIPVNRLQRLEVPLTVFWQAARPLKIVAGLSLTRTLTAKAAKQNYSGGYILKLADRTAEDGASKLSSSELDNWSADAMVGAGMRLSRSFEVGVSAKMPMNKFPGLEKTNSPGVNAGLVDQSLGSTRKQNGPVFSLYGTLFF